MRQIILAIVLLAAPATAIADLPWRVCFTPGQDCTDLVVQEIAGAQHEILVQAYSFTSVPILAALKVAHARGVDVEVIVDKTSARQSATWSSAASASSSTSGASPHAPRIPPGVRSRGGSAPRDSWQVLRLRFRNRSMPERRSAPPHRSSRCVIVRL
jgi:PLD-like domain